MAKKAKKGVSSALDLGMAAFAGTAAGFVMFAMPGSQFDRMVELSGLPLLLGAAQPPLGMTARAAAVIAAAAGTWTLVWLILRALSKKPPQPRRGSEPQEMDMPVPRLRRADAHPDAPARAPIFAGHELGAPLDDVAESPEPFEEPDQPYQAAADVFEPFEADDVVYPEPEPEPEPVSAYSADISDQTEPTRHDFGAGDGFDDFMEADGNDEALADEPEFQTVSYSPPPAERRPADEPAEDSIAHLMQRLELGLLRLEQGGAVGPSGPAEQAPKPAPPMDDRLRSAIDDLQRLAARGG